MANASSDPAVFQRLIVKEMQKNAHEHLKIIYDDPTKYTEAEQLEIFMKFHAERLAFSYSEPAPSAFLKQRFADFLKVRFAELDKNQKPTGRIIESTVDKLPELISVHPVVKYVLQNKIGELLFFRSIAGSYFTAELNEFSALLANVKDSAFFGTSQREILRAADKVNAKLESFSVLEDFLEKSETGNLSSFQIFPHEFFIMGQLRNAAVPSSVMEKLKKVEKEYME